jgi:hypothetical protein
MFGNRLTYLVFQLPIIFLTIFNWDWRKLHDGHGPEASWTGDLFMEYWLATQIYFIVDLLWVANVPICVKSPGTIIKVCVYVIRRCHMINGEDIA